MARPTGPITVCVINLKGGVGKSTISTLLARHAFNFKRSDVLAIDLDPQANLSQALMRNGYGAFLRGKRPSIVEIFNGYLPPHAGASKPGALPGAAAIETIIEVDGRSLQLVPSRFDFADNLTNALRPDPRVLAKYLAGNFANKDLIIIDCAPTESILTRAAYHASGKVLVPVKPEFFATIGFPLLNRSLEDFRRQNLGQTIEVAGVVINNAFYDGGNGGGPEKGAAMADIKTEAAKNSWPIFKNELPFSRGFPKMMRGDYSYRGNSTQFKYFAEEFFNTIGL
ncbi:chromosome partitioning protein [Paraburkholderia sartisoli]|uniref:Chromosome partitioning protein n=2 Tax=Paraburkholderia sartisoli TaxID=83784 RepID=A0A1H4G0J8_9BURK|nr:chromosome partitioning protein [Paraburkholderia sartisoli]